MPPIESHILVGSNAGRRLLLEQSPITIGRSTENDLVIDLSYVSRRHAELRFADDQWWLVNHSPNGTRLNRRWVTDTPRAIESASRLTIGEEVVMELTPQAAAHAGAPDDGAAEQGDGGAESAAGGSGMSRRSKVWIGIGVYLVLMLGLIAFALTLQDSTGAGGTRLAPELTTEQIEQEIQRRPTPAPPDERRARGALAEASELFHRRESEVAARYRALEAYRAALRYMPGHELPKNIDRRRYRVLQQELMAQLTEQYQSAYNLLRSQQYERALEAFRQLLRMYPAGDDSRLVRNAERHAALARRRSED